MRRLTPLALGLGLSGLLAATATAAPTDSTVASTSAVAMASAAPADSTSLFDFTPFAGYTTVTMGSVNRALAGFNDFLSFAAGPGANSSTSYLNGAWIAGGDLMTNRLTADRNLSFGVRGEYLQTNQANSTISISGSPEGFQFQDGGTLTGALLGGRYRFEQGHGLELSVGAYAGLGYATMSQSFQALGTPSLEKLSALYQGEGFMGDLDLRLAWTVPGASWLSINAQGGYRYASLGDLSSRGGPMGGPLTMLANAVNEPELAGGAVDADFSGLTAEGALKVSF